MKFAAEGNFEAVARIICAEPPQWLPVALAHYAVWIDGDDASDFWPEIRKRIQQMQEAVRVLENSLPIWQHLPFDIQCPPAVKTILEALPGLKAEITKLNRPRPKGRKPDAMREQSLNSLPSYQKRSATSPIKLGGSSRWLLSECEAALQSMIEVRS